jgi:hypothetical protein
VLAIDIGSLPSAGRQPGRFLFKRRRYFLSAEGASGTGDAAAVCGKAKQLEPLALVLSSQIGRV